MAYKQNFKSPILKALVGKQHNLPQHLQDAIKAAPESPAKQTTDPPNMRKKQFEDARNAGKQLPKRKGDNVYGTRKLSKKGLMKDPKDTGIVYGPKRLSKKGTMEDPKDTGIVYKKSSPAKKGDPKKGSKYKGGGAKTDAQMADRTRRVNEGLTVRRKDYAPGKDGQAAFNADRRASFDNRRTKNENIRKRLKSGEITKQEAQAERTAYGKEIYNSRSTKKSKADRNMGDKPTTFVVSRKGIKRKVSDAEKASYNSVAKKTVDPTKPKKKMRKAPSPAESKARREAMRGDASKAKSSNPRRMSKSKVKKQGRPTSINGNVIKY